MGVYIEPGRMIRSAGLPGIKPYVNSQREARRALTD